MNFSGLNQVFESEMFTSHSIKLHTLVLFSTYYQESQIPIRFTY